MGFRKHRSRYRISVSADDPVLDGLAGHVAVEFEAAFAKLWARLEGVPEPKYTGATPHRSPSEVGPLSNTLHYRLTAEHVVV